MSSQLRRIFLVAVVLLVVIVVVRAYLGGPEPPEVIVDVVIEQEPEPVEEVVIQAEKVSTEGEPQEVSAAPPSIQRPKRKWKPIEKAEVPRGGGVRFTAAVDTAWIMIPDARFKKYGGGVDWAKGKTFIAFKIDDGEAVVRVPKDYPGPAEIFYSVLVRDDEGTWEYVHGENPPPRIRIP
jgi:hypothetical protein